jgi:hypothetical protein
LGLPELKQILTKIFQVIIHIEYSFPQHYPQHTQGKWLIFAASRTLYKKPASNKLASFFVIVHQL